MSWEARSTLRTCPTLDFAQHQFGVRPKRWMRWTGTRCYDMRSTKTHFRCVGEVRSGSLERIIHLVFAFVLSWLPILMLPNQTTWSFDMKVWVPIPARRDMTLCQAHDVLGVQEKRCGRARRPSRATGPVALRSTAGVPAARKVEDEL